MGSVSGWCAIWGRVWAMILRNHGLLTLGASVAEAFILMVNFERACRVQIAIQSSGQMAYPVPSDICELTAQQYASGASNSIKIAMIHLHLAQRCHDFFVFLQPATNIEIQNIIFLVHQIDFLLKSCRAGLFLTPRLKTKAPHESLLILDTNLNTRR